MKTNITFIAPLFIILISIFSCKTDNLPKIEQDFTHSGIDDSCILHDNRPGWVLKRIQPDCAINYINGYSDYVNYVASTFGNDSIAVRDVLSNGAFIRLEELEMIVHEAKTHGYREVFATMAKIPDNRSDLMFAIRKVGEPDSTIFYNFTHPCPDMCPWEMQSAEK